MKWIDKLRDVIAVEADRIGVEKSALMAFIDVESGGQGFDPATGKIMIQFEPAWFRKKVPYAPSGSWSLNGVERQAKEWIAFNDAFKKDANAAMESTSIGLGQVMGFNYKRLGYATVGAMWDDAKKGESRQIYQMARFIETDARLIKALREKNWHLVATYYNGAGYRELAKRIGREPYDVSMKKAYDKHLRLKAYQ